MIPLLPKWHLHGNRPTFYDADAVTMLELASTLHGTMNAVIDDYNKFVDATNKTIADFISGEIESREVFETAIRQEYQDFIDVVELKLKDQDKQIEELDQYIRTNISKALSDMLKEMKENGEIDEAVLEAISSMEEEISGIRRKVGALGGYLDDVASEVNKNTEFTQSKACFSDGFETDTKIRLSAGSNAKFRQVSISLNPTSAKRYALYAIGGYNFTQSSLYSTTSTNIELVGIWVDGVKYTSFDEVASVTFNDIMWLYTVTESGYTVNVCTRFSADGMQIIESIPEALENDNPLVKRCISAGTDAIYPLVPSSDNFNIFVNKETGTKYFIETVEDLGQTVVKTFYFA